MSENKNILLITDDYECEKLVVQKLVLLRDSDRISVSSSDDIKSYMQKDSYYVVMLHCPQNSLLRSIELIRLIKSLACDVPIILLLDSPDKDLILSAYDVGGTDFFILTSPDYELFIKTLNCYKLMQLRQKFQNDHKLLVNIGVYNEFTGFFRRSYLQKLFSEMNSGIRIRNGYFVILTIDNLKKDNKLVKILSDAIKASVRFDDIVASSNTGRFYLILSNIEFEGVKSIIEKIQSIVGNEYFVNAGVSAMKVGQNFDELEQKVLPLLKSAIQKKESLVQCENNEGSWNEVQKTKSYKFFELLKNRKINSIIKPLYRDFVHNLKIKSDVEVLSYVNDSEACIGVKLQEYSSEFVINFKKIATFEINIRHSGLDSPENSKYDVQIGKFSKEYLSDLLEKFEHEICSV